MEEKRYNKGVIVLLVVIIILLSVLCVLFATGTITFNKDKNNGVNGNVIQDNDSISKDRTIISSNSLDEETLKELLGIVGISIDGTNSNNCLNIALSVNNYRENKKEIFSWYASYHKLNTYRYNEEKCQSSNECKLAYSCGACSSISKDDAHKMLSLFEFVINEVDFLSDLPEYDTDYSYSSVACCGNTCPYYITHNISTRLINDSDIIIVDNQTLSEYDMNNKNIVNTTNQTVTYDFKLDSNGEYYLDNVIVDEQ